MEKDYLLAKKLCQMSMCFALWLFPPPCLSDTTVCIPFIRLSLLVFPVLIYEPENPEATQFLLLIQEKLLTGEREFHTHSEHNFCDTNVPY